MSICNFRMTYNTHEVSSLYPRIRDLREDADLTQSQMAHVLNVSQTTYSRYESGALDIPSAALIALAKFHHTSVDYLLGLTFNPAPYEP